MPAVTPTPLSIVPRVTFAFVVLIVTSLNSCVVREVPIKSTAPVVVILARRVFTPVPCKLKLVIGVVPPTTPPKLIVDVPAFTVSALAPSMVVVTPLKLMAALVELKLIACVDNVIGPV